MVDIWAGYFGIFEDQGGWVAGGDPDAIDLDDFTAEGTDYILLNVEKTSGLLDPDLNIKDLPNRLTGSFGMGKVRQGIELTCWVKDTSALIAEELLDLVANFIGEHTLVSDPVIYFVWRKYKAAAWHYKKWKNAGGTQVKYLKCKAAPLKHNKDRPNHIKFQLSITETLL